MTVTNLVALCFARGWQGGTVDQMASELKTTTSDILDADYERMGDLLRKAQHLRYREYVRNSPYGKRIIDALGILREMIDGGEECRGMDSQISQVIRVLEYGE